jgi:hypothetical protein
VVGTAPNCRFVIDPAFDPNDDDAKAEQGRFATIGIENPTGTRGSGPRGRIPSPCPITVTPVSSPTRPVRGDLGRTLGVPGRGGYGMSYTAPGDHA